MDLKLYFYSNITYDNLYDNKVTSLLNFYQTIDLKKPGSKSLEQSLIYSLYAPIPILFLLNKNK